MNWALAALLAAGLLAMNRSKTAWWYVTGVGKIPTPNGPVTVRSPVAIALNEADARAIVSKWDAIHAMLPTGATPVTDLQVVRGTGVPVFAITMEVAGTQIVLVLHESRAAANEALAQLRKAMPEQRFTLIPTVAPREWLPGKATS